MLRQQFQDDLKTALRNKDAARTSAIRLILAELKMKDIDARTEESREGVADSVILSMIENMVKKRQESVQMYLQGSRQDLADKETAEIAILREYLPEPLSEAETAEAIRKTIADIGASSIRDMGVVMNALKAGYAGRMDFSRVGGLVKGALSGG